MTTIGIIPARFRSSRFPGKPLADILGKPMVWHVFQAAKKVKQLDAVYVATEDERIRAVCEAEGMPCLMTHDRHLTGTDRLTECVGLAPADYYVNIQGDEPMIEPAAISTVITAMHQARDPAIVASNAFTALETPSDVLSSNVVKVVMSQSGRALYYSRTPIPHPKQAAVAVKRQLGLYCFARRGLELFASLPPGPLELAETVELMRFIEHDHAVQMAEVHDDSVPVDTPQDLQRVRAMMAGRAG